MICDLSAQYVIDFKTDCVNTVTISIRAINSIIAASESM